MPTAILSHEPPAIPGLTSFQVSKDQWECTGDVSALEAAGCDLSFIKSAIVVQRPAPQYPGITLRPFQAEGVSKVAAIVKRHGYCILGDEMGLGKTVQAAVVGEWLRGEDRALVVCPANVRHQWESWAWKLNQDPADLERRVANLGPVTGFKDHWNWWVNGDASWGITSYAMMKKAIEAHRPRVLILDEPHNYMVGRANSYVKTMWKHGAMIQYKLALTGSPYLSEPKGLWQVLNVGLGARFGKAEAFDFWYCNATVNQFGGREVKGANKEHVTELRNRLRHYMVRREKAQVADQLPKVTYSIRWVDGNKAATSALANAPHTTDGLRRAMEPTLRDKIPMLVQYIQEVMKPCVVFCWRRADCEQVSLALEKAHEPNIVVHGEYAPQARAEMVKLAIKNKLHVITTYGASGTGFDGLQHLSSNFIAHAIDPAVPIILQAVARLDRIGQTEPVTATFFAMHDSVDELIVDKALNRIEDYQRIFGSEKPSEALRQAFGSQIDNDKILQAIFEDIT